MNATSIADDPLRGSRRLLKRLSARGGPDHLPGEEPCRILVGGDVDPARLRSVVAAALGAGEGAGELRYGGLVLEVGTNAHAGSGDAGRWPLAVELRPAEAVPHAAYVDAVTAVLRGVWERQLKAVALCRFADELPQQGESRWRPSRRV